MRGRVCWVFKTSSTVCWSVHSYIGVDDLDILTALLAENDGVEEELEAGDDLDGLLENDDDEEYRATERKKV